MGSFPDRDALSDLDANLRPGRSDLSGDRHELLPPPMNGQSGNSAGEENLRDGGVAPKSQVP